MNKGEKQQNGGKTAAAEMNEPTLDDHHKIEERLEELLATGWVMLPESCTSPCKYLLTYLLIQPVIAP